MLQQPQLTKTYHLKPQKQCFFVQFWSVSVAGYSFCNHCEFNSL